MSLMSQKGSQRKRRGGGGGSSRLAEHGVTIYVIFLPRKFDSQCQPASKNQKVFQRWRCHEATVAA